MPIKIDVKLDEKSIMDYSMYQIYTKGVGIVSIVLGVLNLFFVYVFFRRGEYPQLAIFALFAVVVLFGLPFMLRRSVRKNISKDKRLDYPVSYEFSEEGVKTIVGNKSGKASWKTFTKAISRKSIIVLFDAKKQSIVLPISQLGEEYTTVVDLIFDNMPAPAVRIMRLDKKK
ncbi:MAG: YcxB family protein [Suipraeoptans sp.]